MKIYLKVSKIKNKLERLESQKASKIRTTEPQQNFTGSCKKKRLTCIIDKTQASLLSSRGKVPSIINIAAANWITAPRLSTGNPFW